MPRKRAATPVADGAEANTVLILLLASCRLHKLEPWTYLRDVLCLLSFG